LDAQGAQLDPIQGDATFAMPRAHSILSYFVAKMPIDDRIIEADDVFYDGPADNAGTGTCFDWITPKLFITGEGHERHVLLSQFMLMLPDYHFKGTPTTGGRSSSTFTDILDQMLSVIAAAGQHRAFEELPFQAQATALVAWWKRTRPPVMLIPYVSNPCMEVERRAVETRAEVLDERRDGVIAQHQVVHLTHVGALHEAHDDGRIVLRRCRVHLVLALHTGEVEHVGAGAQYHPCNLG
jgi:hypothetical protein